VEVGEPQALLFGNTPHRAFQRMLRGFDAAVVTRFGVTRAIENRDDNTRRE